MGVFLGATAKFLLDPIALLVALFIAFFTKKNRFFVRVSLVWITLLLMAILFLGVEESYQYIAASVANFILAVVSVLIVKSKSNDQ